MSVRRSLQEIWPELEAGISQVIKRQHQEFPLEVWMKIFTFVVVLLYVLFIFSYCFSFFLFLLFSLVHDYCTSGVELPRNGQTTGAHFGGEDLYLKLVSFLENYMEELLVVCFIIIYLILFILFYYFLLIFSILKSIWVQIY